MKRTGVVRPAREGFRMAEIAHPYESTTEDAAIRRRSHRVSFSELVEAWAFRESGTVSEDRFQELREAFVRDHGEITDAYISTCRCGTPSAASASGCS
jgi:hypothetical protein